MCYIDQPNLPRMKQLIFALSIACSACSVHAQKIDLPLDQLQTLLCRKWQTAYSMMGNMRIDMAPGAPAMTFEFKKDGTFLSTTGRPREIAKGTWTYVAGKKIIQLLIEGRSNFTIVSLNEKELVMSADMKEATPDDPTPITIVYKISDS